MRTHTNQWSEVSWPATLTTAATQRHSKLRAEIKFKSPPNMINMVILLNYLSFIFF